MHANTKNKIDATKEKQNMNSNRSGANQGADAFARRDLSGGTASSVAGKNDVAQAGMTKKYDDLQKLTPKAGRLGIEEIPFGGQDPVPQLVVPPPDGGWGPQVTREDALQRFENRNTQGLDGGGRSTNITRFTPQLAQWQQPDDASRFRMFERNQPSTVKRDVPPFV